MDVLHFVTEPDVDLNLCCICQRKSSSDEKLYGGSVGQDNLVKGALDFQDDERSKRVLSVDSNKRSQMKYHNNTCYSNFLKAVKRHQAKARSHISIHEDISGEPDTS